MNWIVVLKGSDLYHVVSVVELSHGRKLVHLPMNEDIQIGDIIYVAGEHSVVYRMKVEKLRVKGDGCLSSKKLPGGEYDCLAHITHQLTVASEVLSLSNPLLSDIKTDEEHLFTAVLQKLQPKAADYLSDIFDNADKYRDNSCTSALRIMAIISDY